MIFVHLVIFLAAIAVGIRLGGIGIGFAGGAGVLVMGLAGATPGDLPMDVIVFIVVVIVAAAAMQEAGGLDYLVDVAERVIRSQPRYVAILGPLVTFVLTLMASTGQISFALMPVIVQVAKENNIRPKRALTLSVVGSLLGITASPISAATIFLSTQLEANDTGWGFTDLLLVVIPATLLALVITCLLFLTWDKARNAVELSTLPEYRRRLEAGEVAAPCASAERELKPGAKRSVLFFLLGLVGVLVYAILISDKVGVITDPVLSSANARIASMLAVAMLITAFCKVDVNRVPFTSVFRIGMTANVCILGVAWLGTTFMSNHEGAIGEFAGAALRANPWLLALVVLVAASFLYSQAATTKALMPTALALGIAPSAVVAAFPATSALFVLPNYPTLLAAVEMDDTGSTRLGKRYFDHPFMLPGLTAVVLSVALSFAFGALVHP